jgi:hypothetical protein
MTTIDEPDAVDILVTYSRREDDTIIINSLAKPVVAVLRHFSWAAMIRSEGWLIPHARLPLAITALRGAGVTCVDTCAAFTDVETLMPPPANRALYAPQAECAECAAPYPATFYIADSDPCWRCGNPLKLVRPLIVGDGEPLTVEGT